MTGNIELMNQDLELSMKYDLSSPFPYRIKGTLQLENCQNEEAIINYTKSIDCDKTYTAIESRAKLFEILKYYDRAIEDYKTSMERFGRKNSLFYKIGKCYFMNGDIENAQVYYNEFLKTTKKYRNFYEKSYSYGLISSYNITTGIGWILCNTYFNEFDNIFFKNLDVQQIYSKGDKVKFNIEYEVFKNQLKPCAKFVNKIFTLDFDDYKKHKIYHGIFHHSTNTLKNRKVDSKVQLICQDHAMCVEVMNGAEEMVVLLTQLNQYWAGLVAYPCVGARPVPTPWFVSCACPR